VLVDLVFDLLLSICHVYRSIRSARAHLPATALRNTLYQNAHKARAMRHLRVTSRHKSRAISLHQAYNQLAHLQRWEKLGVNKRWLLVPQARAHVPCHSEICVLSGSKSPAYRNVN
jgi:hypothetical protein